MATPADFFPRVIPYALYCPTPTAAQAVVDAAVRLCEQAQVWRSADISVAVTAGMPSAAVTLPADSAVVVVETLFGIDRVLRPRPYQDRPVLASAAGKPMAFFASEALVVFDRLPEQDETLTARVALKPTYTALALPDILLTRWAPAVAAEALAILHGMPGQPFSDAAKAQMEHRNFEYLAGLAREESLRGTSMAQMRIQARPFA